jgi:anti-sigma factor RsiW
LLGVFADGELPADKVIEVEQHLADCGACAERVRFDAALRASVRRSVTSAAAPSAAFQQRIAAALAAERQREELNAAEAEPAHRHGALTWRTIVPLAAAAAASVVWAKAGVPSPAPKSVSSEFRAQSNLAVSTADTVDELIDEFVRNHQQPPEPAVTEPALVPQLEPEVGVPVHLPSLQQYGARWEGGSTVRMPRANRRAASFRYQLGGQPVTLYVYDSQRFPLRATLEPVVVRDQPVYVGNRRGYTLAAVERRGVGYAIATELNDRESAELVVATVH